MSKVILQLLGFVLLRFVIGQKSLAPLYQPTRSNTKTSHDFLVRVFLRLVPAPRTRICYFATSFDWFVELSTFVVFTLVLVLRHFIKNHSIPLSVRDSAKRLPGNDYIFKTRIGIENLL